MRCKDNHSTLLCSNIVFARISIKHQYVYVVARWRNQIARCGTEIALICRLHSFEMATAFFFHPLFINLIIKWVFLSFLFLIFLPFAVLHSVLCHVVSFACSRFLFSSIHFFFATPSNRYEFLSGYRMPQAQWHTTTVKTFAWPCNQYQILINLTFIFPAHKNKTMKMKMKLNEMAPQNANEMKVTEWRNIFNGMKKMHAEWKKRKKEKQKRKWSREKKTDGRLKWITVIDTLLKINWKKNWIHSIILNCSSSCNLYVYVFLFFCIILLCCVSVCM